jgi:hypothetical protein
MRIIAQVLLASYDVSENRQKEKSQRLARQGSFGLVEDEGTASESAQDALVW